MARARKDKAKGEQPPQGTMQLVDAASLDAKINAIRSAWTEVEIRRLKRKEELKALADRITATSDQLASMCRNDRVESLELWQDTVRGLQLKIDKLEVDHKACADRWKAKLEEAEQTFRNALFGEQLPLLLTAGETASSGEPSPVVGEAADAQVIMLALKDGRMLRVGGRVMIHGAGAHRPGLVLELEDHGDDRKHAALVRYDGDDPTPAHVMAHQCHPLDGLEGEPAKGKRGRKRAEQDSVAGEFEAKDETPDVPAGALARGKRGPKPLGLADRVCLVDETTAMSDSVGTIEALPPGDTPQASVRWDSAPERLHDVDLEGLRRASKQDEEINAQLHRTPDDDAGEVIDAAFDSEAVPEADAPKADEPEPVVEVAPLAFGRRKTRRGGGPPDDVA